MRNTRRKDIYIHLLVFSLAKHLDEKHSHITKCAQEQETHERRR
ncbi:hypothetical protein HMPREF1573_00251 [Gardnerella vaginalis JCP7276]|nr:hypothetical protein HMPREF1575_00095 [Gardnerella vaginalis JCP7672]EPI57433.1 hypothetical protein HMPREF1573_00251 [Gardnerella vaginalis JCP7276]